MKDYVTKKQLLQYAKDFHFSRWKLEYNWFVLALARHKLLTAKMVDKLIINNKKYDVKGRIRYYLERFF